MAVCYSGGYTEQYLLAGALIDARLFVQTRAGEVTAVIPGFTRLVSCALVHTHLCTTATETTISTPPWATDIAGNNINEEEDKKSTTTMTEKNYKDQ